MSVYHLCDCGKQPVHGSFFNAVSAALSCNITCVDQDVLFFCTWTLTQEHPACSIDSRAGKCDLSSFSFCLNKTVL